MCRKSSKGALLMADMITSFEIRLLLCSLDGATANPSEALPISADHCFYEIEDTVENIVANLENGEIRAALCSPAVKAILWKSQDNAWKTSRDSASDFYGAVRLHIDSFLQSAQHANDDLRRLRALLLMGVGIAALLAFWQVNFTGPPVTFPSCCSFILEDDKQISNEQEWNSWAVAQLMVDGCDVVGLFSLPQYLILAKIILVDTFDVAQCSPWLKTILPSSFGWWARRALFANQSVLAERSSSLYASLTALTLEGLLADWEACLGGESFCTIKCAMQLEYGLAEYAYGRVDQSRSCFEAARESCGIELALTGALGYRTVHQVDAKAQMVLLAKTPSERKQKMPKEADQNSCASHEKDVSNGLAVEEDVLRLPRFIASNTDGLHLSGMRLSSFEQVVVLAQCLLVKKSNPDDELRGWQMAPYIEAVDSQEHSHFLIRHCCQLLRIRWECTRSRTKQRALLMLQQLVADIQGTSSASVQQRMCYSFCLQLPALSVLRKELAEMMVSCGLVGEALQIFEELELWNSLIDCYCLLGKKAAASNLIKERLNQQPDDPRLWCALGDVSLKDECYEKAWEVSKHRFGRAKRSLGRSAYNKGDYVSSMQHWESALALNSLQPDGWFALGSAALKARELGKAVDAFTRTVQLEPDNGEAWNNIAAIHMTKKKNKEAFVAFKEALKFKRTSWQMWENYAQVALDVQKFGQAVEAVSMVLDLSQGKQLMVECLSKLMEEIEGQHNKLASYNGSTDLIGGRECGDGEFGQGRAVGERVALPLSCTDEMEPHATEREWLTERVGQLLARVVQRSPNPATWGLVARWHRLRGDLVMCSEALLKQVRGLQGSDWQHDRDRFEELCQSVLQLSDVYIKVAQETGSKKDVYSVQMLLRNLVKQGEAFCGLEIYDTVVTCLASVQQEIQKMQ